MNITLPFNQLQIIWTLLFASQLVLLVVLIGRERTQRFWWFTASIAVSAVRELINLLLTGRISQVAFSAIYHFMAILAVLLTVFALVEITRNLFTASSLRTWTLLVASISFVSALCLYLLIPWSAQGNLDFHTQLGMLSVLHLVAICGQITAAIAAVVIGVAALFFAPRTKGFWSSHALKILAGFTTYSLVLISELVIGQWISTLAHATNLAFGDYERTNAILERLLNLPYIAMIIVQIWWIYSLWQDEGGVKKTAPGK